MKANQIGSCVCLILLLSFSSNCGILGLGGQSQRETKQENKDKSDDRLYYLDTSTPSFSQPIDPSDQAESAKFVRVEGAEGFNPKSDGVTFKVYYQPANAQKVHLGGFPLYPADNPGKFIVATQGKVGTEGSIVLSMVVFDKVKAGDQVKVGIKRIRFVKAPQ